MKKHLDKCSYSCYTTVVATFVIGGINMSNTKHVITDSEYEIMKILWKTDAKMTVADVVKELDGNTWTASTVSTFLQRLLKKDIVACDKKGKTNLYYPVLNRTEYDINETESFLSKLYKGSVKNLVAALYENKKLSKEDVSDLKKMFELE